MRANQIFILSLIALSCVSSTSFTAQLSRNAELKSQVEGIKAQKNMGSIIMTMAEMATSEERFTALFDAIDSLTDFLVKDRAQEMKSFREATAQWQSDVERLEAARDAAKALYESDQNLLTNKLYPERKRLIALISKLEGQLSVFQNNLATLRSERVKEIATFKARQVDYQEGVAACEKALPILKGLLNGQSFAELNEDIFAQISTDLKAKLGRLEYGALHVVFVDSLIQTLQKQNFVDQGQLQKVIDLIASLQSRLSDGLVALVADEAANLAQFEKAQATLVTAIADTEASLKLNRQRKVDNDVVIAATEKHRDEQIEIYKQNVESLRIVNKNYVQRTADNKEFIADVDAEEATIAQALVALNKAGIRRGV